MVSSMTNAGKLQILSNLIKTGLLSNSRLQEEYVRFGIPILSNDFFNLNEPHLVYQTQVLFEPEAVFESPLDTKLGKSLYGR